MGRGYGPSLSVRSSQGLGEWPVVRPCPLIISLLSPLCPYNLLVGCSSPPSLGGCCDAGANWQTV